MYLQSCINQRLIINQMQLSVAHTTLIDPTDSVQLNEADKMWDRERRRSQLI